MSGCNLCANHNGCAIAGMKCTMFVPDNKGIVDINICEDTYFEEKRISFHKEWFDYEEHFYD